MPTAIISIVICFIFVGVQTAINLLQKSLTSLDKLTLLSKIYSFNSHFVIVICTMRENSCFFFSIVKALLLYTILRRENEVIQLNVECEKCLIYPVKINSISYSNDEDFVIIDVDSLDELKMIADGFQKPLLYDNTHYFVIFDKEMQYRTKKPIF